MILAIDVGNTNIVIGCVDNGKIGFMTRMATDKSKTADQYAIKFDSILNLYHINIDDIQGSIISSVVPPLNNILKESVHKLTGLTPLMVGPGIKTGLNILIDNPDQLGSDLVVDAVAAAAEYKKPLAIIDMGTATTISVIDKNFNYCGGIIIPGVNISQEALSSRTSQLPHIDLEPPQKVIGTNTIDCMKSGLVFGSASMIDGMIDRIEEELGEKVTVVATGGLSKKVISYCKKEIIYDNDLLIKGLSIIYDKNK